MLINIVNIYYKRNVRFKSHLYRHFCFHFSISLKTINYDFCTSPKIRCIETKSRHVSYVNVWLKLQLLVDDPFLQLYYILHLGKRTESRSSTNRVFNPPKQIWQKNTSICYRIKRKILLLSYIRLNWNSRRRHACNFIGYTVIDKNSFEEYLLKTT